LKRALLAVIGRTGVCDAMPVVGFEKRSMIAPHRLVNGLLAVVALATVDIAAAWADSYYVGDQTDNTSKTFDATGNSPSTFIPVTNGRSAPRGILHLSNESFLVAYQNSATPIAGEIDERHSDGTLTALIPSSDPHAPLAPRGMVLGPDGRTLYVADFGKDNIGAVETYDVETVSRKAEL
jgi:DNA-binding beta-propeller fold protein YncE